jgi:predicted phage-related endonuclease
MNDKEIDKKVKRLHELKQIVEQLEDLIEDLKDEIKLEMSFRGIDTLNGVDWKITWKDRTLIRLDRNLLEKDFGDLSKYEKITNYKSFYLKKF